MSARTCDARNGDARCTLEPHEGTEHQDTILEVGWSEGWGQAELDMATSASRQHYIDTGRYLLVGEAIES